MHNSTPGFDDPLPKTGSFSSVLGTLCRLLFKFSLGSFPWAHPCYNLSKWRLHDLRNLRILPAPESQCARAEKLNYLLLKCQNGLCYPFGNGRLTLPMWFPTAQPGCWHKPGTIPQELLWTWQRWLEDNENLSWLDGQRKATGSVGSTDATSEYWASPGWHTSHTSQNRSGSRQHSRQGVV